MARGISKSKAGPTKEQHKEPANAAKQPRPMSSKPHKPQVTASAESLKAAAEYDRQKTKDIGFELPVDDEEDEDAYDED